MHTQDNPETRPDGPTPPEKPDPTAMRRTVTAAALGNVVEWYDFGVYGYMAGTVGDVFFPAGDSTVSLLAALGTFAVAFVMRPLGALFFGPLGDRVGRKPVLAITILLMSGATVAIGLLPGRGTIGVTAPALLVLCRLVQGFSTGGEYGGAASFVSEYAPDRNRGFVSSWLDFSCLAGFGLGAGVATALTSVLSDASLTAWGWRVPFLIAGPLGAMGLYLRLKLDDTPHFKALVVRHEVARTPLRETLRSERGGILRVLWISTMANSGQYMVFTYMPNYLSSDESLNIGDTAALMVVLVAIALMMATITWFGALSDRVGRRPVMIASGLGLILLTYPLLSLIAVGTWPTVSLGVFLLAILVVSNMAPLASTLVALFPTRTRYSGFSVGYNIGVAAFGGTTPFIATYLVHLTGNTLAPAFYLMATAAAGVIALWRSEESAGAALKQT